MKHLKIFESLPQQSSVDQLKRLRKMMKGTDVSDKLKGVYNGIPNTLWDRNPVDTGVESYQEYQNKNKKFVPNWNLKNLKPFRN